MLHPKAKICFLIPTMKTGGIETYLLRFLQLYSNKIYPIVIVKSNEKDDLYNEYKRIGIKIIPKKIGYFNVKNWLRLYGFFRHENFNTVCDMGANFAGIPLTIARLAGVQKRIAFYRQSTHHFHLTRLKILYANFVNWLVYLNATTILANSQYALNFYFRKKIDSRCKVIKNGVNKELFKVNENKEQLRNYFKLPEDKVIIGHTGRVAPAKNHKTIFEVARKVCNNNANVLFVLAGDNTQDLPKQDGIITLGYCYEIPKLLKTFDVFYFPSLTEGQPNSLIEAMISGLPFVASDIAPIKECVPESHFSQLIDAADVQASKAKIEEIINSDSKEKYCCRNWAIEEYNAFERFMQFYKELI